MKKMMFILLLVVSSSGCSKNDTVTAPLTILLDGTYSADFTSVYFTDIKIGYILGNNKDSAILLQTINGGITWAALPIAQIGRASSLFFTDVNTGYIVGSNLEKSPVILKTINGGTTWTKLQIPFSYYPINDPRYPSFDIYFPDTNTGYVTVHYTTGPDVILKTINGGASWTTLALLPTIDIFATYFKDADTGYTVGSIYPQCCSYFGDIFVTIDGGNSWNGSNLWMKDGHFVSVHFTDNNTGYAIGWLYPLGNPTSVIYKTTDGGTTWIALPSVFDNRLNEVKFTDANVGYAVGSVYNNGSRDGVILKTVDGGITWVTLTLPAFTLGELISIYFLNDMIGYVVGKNGTILKTTTGGQ